MADFVLRSTMIALLTLAGATPLVAQESVEAEAENSTDAFDAGSRAALDGLIARLARAQTLAAKATVDLSYKLNGNPNESISRFDFAYTDNEQVAIRLIEGRGGTIVADGGKLHFGIPDQMRFGSVDLDGKIDDLYLSETFGQMNGGVGNFIGALIHPDAATNFYKGVASAQHVGRETIEEVEYDRVRIGQDGSHYDVWVSTDEDHKLLKLVPNMDGKDQPQRGLTDLALVISFADWRFDQPLAKGAFAPPRHPLVGQDAPDFELKNLAGEAAKLSDHKGKQIVVLDFWATWCGPCVKALPALKKVTEKYADRGVVFYAVNQREGVKKIQGFFEQQKLTVPVLRDTDGAVADLYLVRGIPQTVIVGNDGKIQALHIGASPDLEQQLDGELKKLVAGESLIGD